MTRPATALHYRAHLLLLLPLVLGGLLAWHSLSDRDIWFHARAGADLLQDGRPATVNRYSYTAADHPWLNHEWLFQVLATATAPSLPVSEDDPLGGWSALRLVLVLLAVTVLVAGDGLLGRGAGSARLLVAAAAGCAALAVWWTRLILRPELLSYLLLPFVVRGSESAVRDGVRRAADWLDPRRPAGRASLATLLWAQCHGFAALAPLVWLLAGALPVSAARGRMRCLATGAIGAAVAVAMLAVTPNGPAGLLFPVRALGQFGAEDPGLARMITELLPLQASIGALGLSIAAFRLSLAWLALWLVLQRFRLPALRLTLTVLAALAALQAQRMLGVYAVLFVLLHTGTVLQPWPQALRRRPWTTRLPFAFGVGGLVLAVAAFAFAVATDRFYLREGVARRFGAGLTPAHAPTATLSALAPSAERRVLAGMDGAGAVLAARRGTVFIDGRTEAYPASMWAAYASLLAGGAGVDAVLDRWPPDAVLLVTAGGAADAWLARMLARGDWRLTAADGASVLLEPAPGSSGPAVSGALAALLAKVRDPDRSSARRADYGLAAARLATTLGQDQVAEQALAAALEARPDHPLALHNFGNALLERGEAASALDQFRRAFARNPRQAGSALNAGVCAMRLGRYDEAARWFRAATGAAPTMVEAWANLAACEQRLGNREQARKALERAVELRPGDARLRERLRAL